MASSVTTSSRNFDCIAAIRKTKSSSCSGGAPVMNCRPTFRRILPPVTTPRALAIDNGENGVFFEKMLKYRPNTVSISFFFVGHSLASSSCSSKWPPLMRAPSSFSKSGFHFLQLKPCVVVVCSIFKEKIVKMGRIKRKNR